MNDFLTFNCGFIAFEKLDVGWVHFPWQQLHLSRWLLFENKDSAPAHRARLTVEFLHKEVSDFISPELWPPGSSDLNAVAHRSTYTRSQYMTWLKWSSDWSRQFSTLSKSWFISEVVSYCGWACASSWIGTEWHYEVSFTGGVIGISRVALWYNGTIWLASKRLWVWLLAILLSCNNSLQVANTCISFIKWHIYFYNLVMLAKNHWRSVTGKVTVGIVRSTGSSCWVYN